MALRLPTDRRRRADLVLALIEAVQATVREADMWLKLGFATGTRAWIADHPQLLQSLHYGDDDYDGHVVTALEHILAQDAGNAEIVAHFGDVPSWLDAHRPDIVAEYLRDEPALRAALGDAAYTADGFDIESYTRRIYAALPRLDKGTARGGP